MSTYHPYQSTASKENTPQTQECAVPVFKTHYRTSLCSLYFILITLLSFVVNRFLTSQDHLKSTTHTFIK